MLFWGLCGLIFVVAFDSKSVKNPGGITVHL